MHCHCGPQMASPLGACKPVADRPARRLRSRQRSRGCVRVAAEQSFGMVLEADTIVVDMHDALHRVAFNRAFTQLGMSSVNWSSRVYYEMRRGGDGTAMGLVRTYFDTVGWPVTMAESDRKPFAMQVVKTKDWAMQKLLEEGNVPLRDGITHLIDEALAADVEIGMLCGTVSQKEEYIGTAVSYALGVQRAQHIRIVSTWDEEQDSEQQSPSTSLAAEAARAQAKVKQQEAAAFSRSMKGVGVDPNILASQRRLEIHHLVRVSQRIGVPCARCALLGATEFTLQAGRTAGMLTVSVPTALAGRFKLPSAQLSFDGFGPGGGVTWSRIVPRLRSASQ